MGIFCANFSARGKWGFSEKLATSGFLELHNLGDAEVPRAPKIGETASLCGCIVVVFASFRISEKLATSGFLELHSLGDAEVPRAPKIGDTILELHNLSKILLRCAPERPCDFSFRR